MKTFIHILLVLLLAQGFGCRKECKKCQDASNPDCENYDPNYGIPTADFTMRQSLMPFGWNDLPENIAEFSDTIVTSESGVLFTAKEDNAIRYEWTIGEDDRKFYTKTVALKFDEYLQNPSNVGKKIPVKLKVVKLPFPGHNQGDSIYQMERFLVFKSEFLWSGIFEGYFNNEPNVKRDITINSEGVEHWFPPGTFGLFPKDSFKLDAILFKGLAPRPLIYVSYEYVIDRECYPNFYSYKQWKWAINEQEKMSNRDIDALSGGLMSYHANAEFSADGRHSIVIKYSYRQSRTSEEVSYIFKGIKKL